MIMMLLQAMRWLSNWSLKQEDDEILFKAADVLQVAGGGALKRREHESVAWRALAECEKRQNEDVELLSAFRKECLDRDSVLIRSYLLKKIQKDFQNLHPHKKLKPFKSTVIHINDETSSHPSGFLY